MGLGRSRGGFTTKLHLSADGSCRPLSLIVTPGQRADCTQFGAVLEKIRVPRIGPGRPRRNPDSLAADKGYDYDHLRRWLRGRGIRHRIARKGVESSQRLGRHRWVVERTVFWLAVCRRLHRRYERKAEHFLAFVGIVASLIGYRRLAALLRA